MPDPEWSTKPYKGGPPVDLPGFPRPLYPPDVPEESGYEPSSRGPDVIAYKRAISRAGRWPWQEFDDGYWTKFAHGEFGKGSDVPDSGVAGFQRQQGLDATGWLGKKTFENMRYARVPEGKPHTGEPVIDAIAQNLLIEAWQLYAGKPPAAAPQGSSAEARIAKAKKYIGVTEYPPGSNRTEFGEWYGMDGNPWCAMYVAFCDQKSGNPSDTFKKGSRYAYVPYILADARAGSYGLSVTTSPRPGDVVVYDWEGNGEYDHVGIFEGWTDGANFTALEGNTSIDNNSNGGEVMRRSRSKHSGYPVFIRVAE